MAFDSKKTILLEKKYLYVRASLGFQLEGTSTEVIPTNNGFYRFYVDNLSKALGNSYVNIIYDFKDLSFQSFCSDLYMDELMSSDSSAIEDVVLELQKNTSKIGEFENGVSSAMESNHQDNVAITAKLEEFESGVSTGMASNHQDNVVLHTDNQKTHDTLSSLLSVLYSKDSFYLNNQYFTVAPSASIGSFVCNFLLSYRDFVYDPIYNCYIYRLNEKIFTRSGNSKPVFNFRLKSLYGKESINDSFSCYSVLTYFRPSYGIYNRIEYNTDVGTKGQISVSPSQGIQDNDVFVHADIVLQIKKDSYDYMVFCDNSFSDRYSFSENSVIRGSSYLDSIYLDIEPNLNSCVFSHKLDITKKFDSVQDYRLAIFAPTSLSTNYLESISKIYVIVNGQQKTFNADFTKTGNSSFPSFYINLSGENFYHITSISFDSVF